MKKELLKIKIYEVEKKLNIVIPDVYREFLEENNIMSFNDGMLYDIDILEERYITLEFAEFASNYIPIGNDNGDYELVMESCKQATKFCFLEQGSIGTLKPENLQDFKQWYNNGHSFSDDTDDNIDWTKNVKVILKKTPSSKAKTMMSIRKVLLLDTPISELLSVADNTPYELTDKYSYSIAKSIIEKNQLDEWLEIKF